MTRCFVLGNGPSLAKTNLDLMIGEVSIGCNKIHLIYPKTKWRPTYWISVERTRQTTNWDDTIMMYLDMGIDVYINDRYKGYLEQTFPIDHPLLHGLEVCDHENPRYNVAPEAKIAHDWHLPSICRWGGTGLGAIQLAVHKGFNPIYTLGMDCNYVDGTASHFVPNYQNRQVHSIQQARLWNTVLRDAHIKALEECKKRGIEIFNAGLVPIAYPQVNYEELF